MFYFLCTLPVPRAVDLCQIVPAYTGVWKQNSGIESDPGGHLKPSCRKTWKSRSKGHELSHSQLSLFWRQTFSPGVLKVLHSNPKAHFCCRLLKMQIKKASRGSRFCGLDSGQIKPWRAESAAEASAALSAREAKLAQMSPRARPHLQHQHCGKGSFCKVKRRHFHRSRCFCAHLIVKTVAAKWWKTSGRSERKGRGRMEGRGGNRRAEMCWRVWADKGERVRGEREVLTTKKEKQ